MMECAFHGGYRGPTDIASHSQKVKIAQICSLLASVMAAGMTEQGMGSSGDNYIFYL